jgi:serine/threonine protein kinase
VIDFGIARALDSATSWTTTGTVLGTPGWMAPEVLTGGKATPAADIFAWGLLMAYAGTGRPAFGEGQALDVARRVVQDRPDLNGLPSGPLGQLIRSALCKNPADRPSAPELMMRLVGREFQSLTAAPTPEPAQPGFRYRKQLMVGGLMAAVAALAFGVSFALPGGGDSAPTVTIQPQVTEKVRAVTTPPLKKHRNP